MATNTLNTRLILCNDTSLNWSSSDKVLLKGELGIELIEGKAPKFKVGDGVNTFAALKYVALTPEEIEAKITAASHDHSNLEILQSITAAYTTEEKTKLTGIADNAEVNVIDSVKVNGKALSVTDKAVDVTVPTKVSELENDKGYKTTDNNTTYTLDSTKGSSDGSAALTFADSEGGSKSIKVKGAGATKVTTDVDGNFVVTSEDTKYTHPVSGVEAGTYKSVTVDEQGHVTGGSNPTTLAEYGITDAANKTHTHTSNDIQSLDAAKLTGMVDIARLPKGALERVIVVEDDTKRFALTREEAQNGDTIKVNATSTMYFVKDETKLDSEEGYEIYTAGSATSVPWSGVSDKPTEFNPTKHTHTTDEVVGLDDALANKATKEQGAKADTAVQSVTLGGTELKVGTKVELPAYPETLPASDVHDWAKAENKPDYTKAEVGLSNVTNDKQVKGLASDTTENHVVVFGADGYTVKDGGHTVDADVPADAKFTDTTYEAFNGATASAAGKEGLVPKPVSGDEKKFLAGDGTWATPTNTDTKVSMTPDATKKAYITGTESATASTGEQVFDTDVYLDTEAGTLVATKFKGALDGNAASASTAAKLTTARNFSITGGVTAEAKSFNGTENVALEVTNVDAAKITVAEGDMLILNGGGAN